MDELSQVASFPAIADATVDATAGASNFGSATSLDADQSPQRETYLSFAVTGTTDMRILSAKVRLYCDNNGTANAPAIRAASSSWTESTITWNNRPVSTSATLANAGVVNAGNWVEYDVTAAITGDGTFAFNLFPESSDNLNVNSREATANRPELVLELSQIISANPTEDAHVERGSPATNFGGDTSLSADQSPEREAFLKFVLAGVTGSVVSSAKLRLYVSDSSANAPAVRQVGNGWSESTITWNNRPTSTNPTLDNKGSIAAGGWVEYDVTAAITIDGTYSFQLFADSDDKLSVNSREATSNKPQLVVTLGGALTAPPTAPTGLTAQSASLSSIALAWTDTSNNESGFEIESSANGSTFTLLATVAADTTSYVHTGLTAGVAVYYRVRALNALGASGFSNVADATPVAGSACANPSFDMSRPARDVWLWDEGVPTSSSKRAEFLAWAEAHHVTRVYAAGETMVKGYSSGSASSTVTAWRTFIQDAANKCIEVEFLIGGSCTTTAKCPSEEPGFATAISLTQKAALFAAQSSGAKPVGIHWDVEPYRHPRWAAEAKDVLKNFAGMLKASRNNAGTLIVNVDIPRWYDKTELKSINCNGVTKDAHKCIIDTVDVTTLMDYRDIASGAIDDGDNEVFYASSVGKKVVIGLETGHEADGVTFFDELRGGSTYSGLTGEKFLEAEIALIEDAFSGEAGYRAVALHHYDSLNQKGSYASEPILENY